MAEGICTGETAVLDLANYMMYIKWDTKYSSPSSSWSMMYIIKPVDIILYEVSSIHPDLHVDWCCTPQNTYENVNWDESQLIVRVTVLVCWGEKYPFFHSYLTLQKQ